MVLGNINFNELIVSIEAMGVYEVILPFMLGFTIIFAILQKVKLFGSSPQTKNFNVVIAIVIAFFLIRAGWIVATINTFLPRVSLVIIIMLMFLLILGIFGTSPDGWTGLPFFLALVITLAGVGWAIYGSIPGFASASWIPSWLVLDAQDKGILLFLGIIFFILFMFKEKPQNPDDKWSAKAYKELSDPSKFGRGGS
jgi:hypothetical protein